MIEIKNTVIEIKKAFNRIISRLDIAEERINEHEDMFLVISKIKCKKEYNRWNKISKNCGIITKV